MLREFVTVNREEIISRCKAKVLKRIGVSPSPEAEIEHGVPVFLDELVDELRLKTLPNPELRKTATKHGRDLMRQGFNVSQVVHGVWRRLSVDHRNRGRAARPHQRR